MTTVQWVDPAGKKEPLLAKPGVYQNPNLSPDGRRVALAVSEAVTNSIVHAYGGSGRGQIRLVAAAVIA